MSTLSDEVRADAVTRLRRAADELEKGDEKSAGTTLLHGLKPVARDLKKTYGPMARLAVNGWIRFLFEE